MNTVQFLSVEWAETYRELWNATPTTRDGTKELDMLIEWRVPDGRAGRSTSSRARPSMVGRRCPSANRTSF